MITLNKRLIDLYVLAITLGYFSIDKVPEFYKVVVQGELDRIKRESEEMVASSK